MSTEKIIVIGAGMSGIVAAKTLHDAGYNVQVIEARGILGGRTQTDSSLGVTINRGGSWIHGQYGNPLTALAKQYNVDIAETDFTNEEGDSVLAFDADGTPLDVDEYIEGQDICWGALQYGWGTINANYPTGISLGGAIKQGLPNVPPLTHAQQLGFNLIASVEMQHQEAADPEEVDWDLGRHYRYLEGGDWLLYGNGGYQRIAQCLAQDLSITLNAPVQKVTYNNNHVEVTTPKGTEIANRVIITVPLGVLKSGMIEFMPALPQHKQTAIEELGMGQYEKLFLKFPDFFWDNHKQVFYYSDFAPDALFQWWVNIGHYTNEPILTTHHGGGRARRVNQLDDKALVDGSMRILRLMFGNDIPEPVAYFRTHWASDPYSCGSYSFDKVGLSPQSRQWLAEPVQDRLFFAGEATHPTYVGTVHAAYETGIRVAREIMTLGDHNRL